MAVINLIKILRILCLRQVLTSLPSIAASITESEFNVLKIVKIMAFQLAINSLGQRVTGHLMLMKSSAGNTSLVLATQFELDSAKVIMISS